MRFSGHLLGIGKDEVEGLDGEKELADGFELVFKVVALENQCHFVASFECGFIVNRLKTGWFRIRNKGRSSGRDRGERYNFCPGF